MKKISKNLFSLSLIALGISAGVHAQEQSEEPQIEEVITVTANKRIERLQDVPASVNVVRGDDIEKLNLTNFSDIEQLAPGLNLTSEEPTINSVTLRGIGFNPNSASSPTVDIYVNETPIDTNSAFKGLYDVGQIEVLRGPQGTLRGKTSPSGAITIATRKADLGISEGYFQQTLSNQSTINTQGAFSLPIIEDVLAVRVAGLFDENNGLGAENLSNGKEDSDKTRSFRTSIAYAPTDTLRVDLMYQYLKNDTTITPILFTVDDAETDPILSPKDRKGKATKAGEYTYEGDILTLEMNWDLDDFALTYVGGYQNVDVGRTTDLAYGGAIEDYSLDQSYISSSEKITNELRLSTQGDNTWDYLIGLYYEDGESSTDLTQTQILPFGFTAGATPPLDIAILDVGVDIPNEGKNFAIFTDHRFQLTDADQLQVGLRYQTSDVQRDFITTVSGVALGPEPIVSSGISEENKDVTYSQVTGALSYRHAFSRDLTGYISYGRSYRPGGVVSTTATLDEDLLVFDEETSDNYEIGLKGAALDRKVNFTVSIYQQDFDNYLAYTSSFLSTASAADGVVDNSLAFTFNADARVRGIEASASSWLTDNLFASISATYNDSTFKGGLAPCNDYNGDGVADSEGMPSVPVGQQVAFCRLTGATSAQADWSVTTMAEYTTELADGEAFVRVLLDYSPERTDPFVKVDFESLFNNSLFLGYRGNDGAYEAALFVKNISDDATLTTRNATQVDYNMFNTGYAVGTPIRPREIGFTFNIKF